MKLAVIGYGDLKTPSHIFRFQAYRHLFEQDGHEVTYLFKDDFNPKTFEPILKDSDIIINQKCLLNSKIRKYLLSFKKPIYFDFDDAIWTRPEKPFSFLTQLKVNHRFKNWMESVDGVMAANSFLANKASSYTNHVHLVPMALNLNIWKPTQNKPNPNQLSIGWNGAPHNLPALETILNRSKSFFEAQPQIKVKIFCGKKPNLNIPFEYFDFIPENETPFIQSLDIGLLALNLDEYAHGKSPIKALQYLSCGVPVLGHQNEGGRDFITPETSYIVKEENQWEEGLTKLIQNPNIRQELAHTGLQLIQKNHSIDSVYQKSSKFFNYTPNQIPFIRVTSSLTYVL